MSMLEKMKKWFSKNKKKIILGGTLVLVVIGTSVGYVIYKNKKIPFSDLLKLASKEELLEVYEKLRSEFGKTGIKTFEMEQISKELDIRGAKEWFEKHPPNLDPNFRWTDRNRWEKD